jgi:hypothetical protein
MCLIIDACVRDLVFSSAPHTDAIPVLNWIENGGGRVAYGGKKLCDELFRNDHARRRLRAWKQAGRACEFPQVVVDAEDANVKALCIAKSNDTHILALARVSGARTLYSDDEALHADFKNPQLVNDPRGCIYQCAKHSQLLTHTSSCRVSLSRLTSGWWS